MMIRLGVPLLLAAFGLTAYTALRQEPVRVLPAERAAALMYVALGDSTVEGIGATSPDRNYVSGILARLRAVYPGARAMNLGVAGATSADVIADQLRRAVDLQPHLVTLSIGPNDLTGGVSVEQYEQNVETILGALSRETTAVVVVNLLPDLAVTPRFAASPSRDAVGRQTERFNRVLARKAKEFGVAIVDLHTQSRAEVPRRPTLIAADGYHPSDEGYARWAELMWNGVAPRIPPG
jgi:acyl-CoA thioesterase-1